MVTATVTTATVSPAAVTLTAGATQQLIAETKDAGNNVLTGRDISWTSEPRKFHLPAPVTPPGGGLLAR